MERRARLGTLPVGGVRQAWVGPRGASWLAGCILGVLFLIALTLTGVPAPLNASFVGGLWRLLVYGEDYAR